MSSMLSVLALCFLSIVGTLPAFQAAAFEDKAVFNANAPAELQQFAFWLGDWQFVNQTRAKAGGPAPVGTSHISLVFDGYGILENLNVGGGSKEYAGGSLTILNPKDRKLYQTWTDNSGYLETFIGGMEGDALVLYSPMRDQQGKKTMTRLVWKNITATAYDWNYESSEDGGATWKVVMEVRYTRTG